MEFSYIIHDRVIRSRKQTEVFMIQSISMQKAIYRDAEP